MGDFAIRKARDTGDSRNFMNALIRDLNALEKIIEEGLIESDIQRIGAEQELCMVDKHLHPAPIAHEVLEGLEDSRFTHELSKFNLEINLDPILLKGNAFSEMENQLALLLDALKTRLNEYDSQYILVGILPVSYTHLTLPTTSRV